MKRGDVVTHADADDPRRTLYDMLRHIVDNTEHDVVNYTVCGIAFYHEEGVWHRYKVVEDAAPDCAYCAGRVKWF